MSLVWKVHSAVRHSVPNPWIKRARHWLEANSDSIWRGETYSQCGEDRVLMTLVLRRAQRRGMEVIPAKGFYVDVGAFSPKQYSNTYLFYKRGWNGINVDATPGSMKLFERVRKRDRNVEAAVSDEPGELTFFTWGTPTVVNTLCPVHAAEYSERIGRPATPVRVQARTLASILTEHVPPGQEIDFMSVDTERHDLNVLRSNDWKRFRPHLVLIEMLTADMAEILKSDILSLMSSNGYSMASWVFPNVVFERVDG